VLPIMAFIAEDEGGEVPTKGGSIQSQEYRWTRALNGLSQEIECKYFDKN
jgi:hypothetical protein